MGITESLILGAVEGITEFLPISSTGHLILASSLLGVAQTHFLKSFEIAIQLGAIAAVIALYWRQLLQIEVLKRLVVAFIPTGIAGFALYGFIKSHLIGNSAVVLWALFLGGIALIIFELLHKEEGDATPAIADMSYKQSAIVGVFQALAMVPGVSRSATSIVGGLLAGMKRVAIVEFSFLLAVPTMLAATGYDLLKNASSFSAQEFGVLAVGSVTSFFVAMLAIRFLLSYVRSHSFIIFGVYRIAVAVLFCLILLP